MLEKPVLSLPFLQFLRPSEKCFVGNAYHIETLLSRVYLKTPNAPGQRIFSRCAAPFFLEIRQYSCEKMSCSAQKFLAAGHIGSFQIHPTRRGTNSPKGFRVCSCLLQTPHNESDRQNRTGLPRVRQAGSVGVEKKEEREERKEKIGLLTSMSIPANHVGTVNESERICELSPHFIPNYCTFFVATISTPVPAAFVSSTSPIFTGACAVT